MRFLPIPIDCPLSSGVCDCVGSHAVLDRARSKAIGLRLSDRIAARTPQPSTTTREKLSERGDTLRGSVRHAAILGGFRVPLVRSLQMRDTGCGLMARGIKLWPATPNRLLKFSGSDPLMSCS